MPAAAAVEIGRGGAISNVMIPLIVAAISLEKPPLSLFRADWNGWDVLRHVDLRWLREIIRPTSCICLPFAAGNMPYVKPVKPGEVKRTEPLAYDDGPLVWVRPIAHRSPRPFQRSDWH